MAGSRTLKLSILADVDDLKKKLNAGSTEVEGFGSKLGDFSKKAGIAFAAAGAAAAAYAGKLLVDGVKAAVEDEKAQTALATTLKNVTKATDAQIASTESYILKTSLAKGITDDELRPALSRLVVSLGSVKKSQELLNLALDISAATGKSVESVAQALAKAYDGNTGALKKLGIQTQIETTAIKDNTSQKQAAERAQLAYNQAIDKYGVSSPQAAKAALTYQQALERAEKVTTTNQKTTLDFDSIIEQLSSKFGGAASANAETFAGKMDRLKIAFDEGKETVGSFVLDAITPLVNFIVEKVAPTLSDLSTTIGEKLKPTFESISTFFTDTLIPTFQQWWSFLSETVIPGIVKTVKPIIEGLFSAFSKIATAIKDNEENLKPLFTLFKAVAEFIAKTLAPAIGTVLGAALKVVGSLVASLITGFSKLVGIVQSFVDKIKALIDLVKNNPLVQGIGNLIGEIFGGGRAKGGAVAPSTSYLVGERGPEMFVPNAAGRIIPNNRLTGNTINITVNGAVDATSTARQIVELLNNEAAVSGSFTNLGLNRFAVRA